MGTISTHLHIENRVRLMMDCSNVQSKAGHFAVKLKKLFLDQEKANFDVYFELNLQSLLVSALYFMSICNVFDFIAQKGLDKCT